jgi:hypothetical protein
MSGAQRAKAGADAARNAAKIINVKIFFMCPPISSSNWS